MLDVKQILDSVAIMGTLCANDWHPVRKKKKRERMYLATCWSLGIPEIGKARVSMWGSTSGPIHGAKTVLGDEMLEPQF